MSYYIATGTASCYIKVSVEADSEKEALQKIKNGDYDDITDCEEIDTERFDCDEIKECE